MIRILESKQVGRLLARKAARLTEAEAVVRPILEAVRRRGDAALMEYARQFDKLERKSVRVPEKELRAAEAALAPEFRSAVETAAANIRRFAEQQMPREWMKPAGAGMRLGQVVRPLDTVAAYIPVGPLSAAFHHYDDGHSRAGGGRTAHLRGLAAACS